ncbi:MAG TPA: hypothetical protein VHY84_13855 [Bryobacteraceae bacterium]|nr:hypothetical protein [Bryobacteraceae bacterium]
MKVVVPHHVTVDQAIQIVDRSADNLFEGAAGGSVELLDRKRSWNGPIMDFSLTARLGFISLPISGTAVVDDVNVTIDCELPALVKTFIGEDKVRAGIERKVRGMLAA